jgi:excisionase family DNA binding protein
MVLLWRYLTMEARMALDQFPQFMTVKEVAGILGFHPETIKRWARDGKIEYEQAGHYGHLRIAWPLRKKRGKAPNYNKEQQDAA